MAQADRISQRVLVATLKQAERDCQNGIMPPASVLDLARWAHEVVNGKPTVHLEASVDSNVVLDPSMMILALRNAREEGQAFLRDQDSPVREVSHDPVVVPLLCEGIESANVHSATSTYGDGSGI